MRTTVILYPIVFVVPMKRFELLRGHPHYALNVARLPVPPHRRLQPRHVIYTIDVLFVKAKTPTAVALNLVVVAVHRMLKNAPH